MSRRRGSGSWLVSFVVFGAAFVAIALAVAGLSDRRHQMIAQPTTETAPREVASALEPARPSAVAAAQASSEPTPVVLRQAAAKEQPIAQPAAAASQQADKARGANASAVHARGEASPFKLDQLPVLEADGAGFDAEAADVPVRPTKAAARRASAPGQR